MFFLFLAIFAYIYIFTIFFFQFSFPSRYLEHWRALIALLYFFSGITAAEIKATQLLACSDGSITLQSEVLRNINMTSINEIFWSYRYTHGNKWKNLVYCRSMTCALRQKKLSDGTQVSRGANGRLIVDHSTQSSSRDHIHFRFEVYWTNGSVDYRIFEVNFTVACKSLYQFDCLSPVPDLLFKKGSTIKATAVGIQVITRIIFWTRWGTTNTPVLYESPNPGQRGECWVWAENHLRSLR